MAYPVVAHYSHGNLEFNNPPTEEKVDAIMVFTGSSDRVLEGYNEFVDGMGKKMMISGFDYPLSTKSKDVKKVIREAKRKHKRAFIDLKAKNTIENAQNGAKWAVTNHVKSILLVTSEDHMPRAYFELRRLLPDSVEIYTKPVEGKIHYAGLDTEQGRLLCRIYETTTDVPFCYKAKKTIQTINQKLL